MSTQSNGSSAEESTTACNGQDNNGLLRLHRECAQEREALYGTVNGFFAGLDAHEGANHALAAMLEWWIITKYRDYAREGCNEDLAHWNNHVRNAFEVITLLASLSERMNALHYLQDQIKMEQGGQAQ